MNAAGWLTAGLAVAALTGMWALRRCSGGRHGGAGVGATSAWQVIEQCRPASAPRPPRWITMRGDLADALADEPTRVLPRVPAPRAPDPELLVRVLDGLHRL
ncbi:hypothetical protein [Saccharopolyspora cebuensis]|uniref:Uncharacterized protein n=1 Tax=Saccharopolyspora cebuensis TaxID=418759 RepID=A0ABV4CJT6_9PSEU